MQFDLDSLLMTEVVSNTDKALRYYGLYDVKSLVGLVTISILIITFLIYAFNIIGSLFDPLMESGPNKLEVHQAVDNWNRLDKSALKGVINTWSLQPMVMVLDALSEAVQKYEPIEEPEDESEDEEEKGSGFVYYNIKN